MEINNKLSKVDSIDPIDSSQLSYAGIAKVGGSVSLATNKEAASNSQHVNNEVSTLKKWPKLWGNGKSSQIEGVNLTPSKCMSDNVVNVQILYNANQVVDP